MTDNISLIVATDEHNGIGFENQLLCHLPDDLKFFKQMTTGHTVVMGRKTFDSIGKPLPNRTNVILSRNLDFEVQGCKTIHSIPYLMDYIPKNEEVFIIGGESIFRQTISYATKIYLTAIKNKFQADSYFPEIPENDWKIISRLHHPQDDKHAFPFSFLTYERKAGSKRTHISQHTLEF